MRTSITAFCAVSSGVAPTSTPVVSGMPVWVAPMIRRYSHGRQALWCVLLTHDASTMARFAYERAAQGLPMPGVFEVRQDVPIGVAIEEVLILAECSVEGEWEGQVGFLPLR